ncbi:MAG: hypothetical protein IJA21_00885 [Clostridia bacterium]|nr:hypothetical protein [Clostridia bacterium]
MFQKNENKKGNLVTLTGADREIIARFTSEMLFNEKGNTLERFINEVNSEDRNAISRFIHDFISWLKARLKGEKVSLKIVKLENRFAAVLRNVDNTNAQKNNTTNDGDVQYEFNENLYKQLNDWLKGGGRKNGAYNGSYFELGTTPNVLIKHGAPAVNVIMYSDVITKITGGKHSIALDEIAKLPTQLNDPILLFKGSVPNSFVALTELVDKNGNDVIVAVHINKHLGRTVINKIASLYSKSDDYGNNKIIEYIKRQILAGNLIDASNIKAPNWFTSRGLQLPKEVQTILDANNKISQKDNVVNTHYTQEGENYSSQEQNDHGNSYSFGDIDKDKSKKYNKAIKVPNVAYRIISSRRTERYANLDDTDIPLTDIVTIGEQRLNTTTQYFIRNNSRSDFVIYKKRKSSPKKGTLEYDINDEIDRAIARHSGLERDNQQNGAQNNSLVPSKRRGTKIRNKRSEENQQPNDRRHNNDTSEASRRRRQLEIIQNTNPAYVDHLTWIRSVEDIHTLQETLEMSDWAPYDEFDPDYSKQDALNAIKNGKIKVYSSHPIGQGVFVTPSKMEAQTYAGDGTVYEQVVNIDDIAWIDPTQGQYAKVEAGLDDSAFSMPENDIQYSFEDDVVDKTSSLAERVRLGEISQAEYLNELQRLMNEATEKYGAIPQLNRDLKKHTHYYITIIDLLAAR